MFTTWRRKALFGYVSLSLLFLEYPKYSPFANFNTKFVHPKKHKYSIGAHRGGSREYFENTIPAFDNAIKQGCDFLEIDVQVTKDNKVVVSLITLSWI